MSNFLPFALPLIEEEEINEVVHCLRSGWLTTGPKNKEFEASFSKLTGSKEALAVNSATAGLHLALEAIGIQTGDKVITTPYTFTATAEVIRYLGADPLFVDIDPLTFNISPQGIADALKTYGDQVKAIVPVHFAGQACDMDPIQDLAQRHQIPIVEDAAHALPAEYKGKTIGNIGDLTVFSFYATKTITTGEGGMVTTNNPDWAKRIRTMRLHGINRDVFDRYTSTKPSWYYEIVAPGYKYNLPDIAAAIGIEQLKKSERFRTSRELIAHRYTEAFADLPLILPYTAPETTKHAWHLYVIQLDDSQTSLTRDHFIQSMSELGIGTSVHFIPLHIQPYWRDRYQFKETDFPNAYRIYRNAVSLPIYPKMTDSDIERVISAVRSLLLA